MMSWNIDEKEQISNITPKERGERMLQPVNKNSRMFEQVLERIRLYITTSDLVPGDKLLTERDMAQTLQVSRSSVREALRILEVFDVIYSKPGEGTILKRPQIPKLLTNILPFISIPTDTSVELLESRKVLEGGIVKLAAKRRKLKDIKLMQDALDRMVSSPDLEILIQADLDFHLHMAKAAYNNTLSDILIIVSDLVSQNLYATRFRMHSIPGVNEKLNEQYLAILQAIKDKNPQSAYEEMEKHLDFSIEMIKSLNTKG
jgi:GntR family transcriptional regulator, transcriptional repressor for pyruvate dehydrogenase complex